MSDLIGGGKLLSLNEYGQLYREARAKEFMKPKLIKREFISPYWFAFFGGYVAHYIISFPV